MAWAEAADHAMLSAHLTKAVDQLVAANLVYWLADRQDWRWVLIHWTARGRRLHAGGSAARPGRGS